MSRECFVRAIDPNDKWHSANVLALTDESFRRFVVERLAMASLLVVVDDDRQGAEPPYRTRSVCVEEKP